MELIMNFGSEETKFAPDSSIQDANTIGEKSDTTLKYQVDIVTNIYINIMAREEEPADWNKLKGQLNAFGYNFDLQDLTEYTHYFQAPAFGAVSPKPPSAQETAETTPQIIISTSLMQQTKVAPVLITGEEKQREQAARRIVGDHATLIFLTSKQDIAEQDKNEKEWTELLNQLQQQGNMEESKEAYVPHAKKQQILEFIKLYDMEIKGLILARVLRETLFLHIDSWQLAYYFQLASDYGRQETNQFEWALGEVQELHNKLQQSPNLAADLLSCLKNHHMSCESQVVNDLNNFNAQTSKFGKKFNKDAFFAYLGFGKNHIVNDTPWLTKALRQRREQFQQRQALLNIQKVHPADKWVSTDTFICIKLPEQMVQQIWPAEYEWIPDKSLDNIHVSIPIQRIDLNKPPLMNSNGDYFIPVVIDDEYSVQEQKWLKKVFDVAKLQIDFKSQKPGIVIHVDHHALNINWSTCIMLHEYQTHHFKPQFESAANRGGRRRTDSSWHPSQDKHSKTQTTPATDYDDANHAGPWSTEKIDGILGSCSELNDKNQTYEDPKAVSHQEVALKCYAYYEEKVGHAFTEFAQKYLQIWQVVECIYDNKEQTKQQKAQQKLLLTLNLFIRSKNNRETIQELQTHLDTSIDIPAEPAGPELSAAKLFRVTLGPAGEETLMQDTNICVPQALHTMVGQRLYKTLGHLLMVGARTDRLGTLGQLIKLASLHSIKVPLSTDAKGDKPWLTFCDENARLKECFLVLKETWSIKTILTVTADDYAFNWRLSSAVQTRTCLLLLVNQPWKGGQRNMITNHALSMKFYRGEEGLQWYYSEHGEAYKPTIQEDQSTPICLQLFQDVFSVQIYQTAEREGKENQAYYNTGVRTKQASHPQSKILAQRIIACMNTNPLGTLQQSVAPSLKIIDNMDKKKATLDDLLNRMESGSNEEQNQTAELKKALLAVILMLSSQQPEYNDQEKEASLQILGFFGDKLSGYTQALIEGTSFIDDQLLWCSLIVNDLIEDSQQSPSWANFVVTNPTSRSVECDPKSFRTPISQLNFENESFKDNCEKVQKALKAYNVQQDKQREDERLLDVITTKKTSAENLAKSGSPGDLGQKDQLIQLLEQKNFIIKALRQDQKKCYRAIAFGCVGDDKEWSLFRKAILLYSTQDYVVRQMEDESNNLDNHEWENQIFVLSAPMFKIKVYCLNEATNTLEHTTYQNPNSLEADDEEEDQKISVLNFCRHTNGYYSYLQTNGANKGLATIKHRNQMARRYREAIQKFGQFIVYQPTPQKKVQDREQSGKYATTRASNSRGSDQIFTTVRYRKEDLIEIEDEQFQSSKEALNNVKFGQNIAKKTMFSIQQRTEAPRAQSVHNQQKTRAKKPQTRTPKNPKKPKTKSSVSSNSTSSRQPRRIKDNKKQSSRSSTNHLMAEIELYLEAEIERAATEVQPEVQPGVQPEVQPEVQPGVQLEVPLKASDQGIGANNEAEKSNDAKDADINSD